MPNQRVVVEGFHADVIIPHEDRMQEVFLPKQQESFRVTNGSTARHVLPFKR